MSNNKIDNKNGDVEVHMAACGGVDETASVTDKISHPAFLASSSAVVVGRLGRRRKLGLLFGTGCIHAHLLIVKYITIDIADLL